MTAEPNPSTTADVVPLRPRSYVAKLHRVAVAGLEFHIAGTLDGFLDFAIIESSGRSATYNITCNGAQRLAAVLTMTVADVQANCLFDRDPLLEKAP